MIYPRQKVFERNCTRGTILLTLKDLPTEIFSFVILRVMKETVKIVVYVPETHADVVRKALGKAGAGAIGDYRYCSFSVKGVGRFIPLESAHPTIGEIGKLEEVQEERIETVCYKDELATIIEAVNKVHPYEEVAFDVYPLVLNPHETTYKK
jgi:hypothetical protein